MGEPPLTSLEIACGVALGCSREPALPDGTDDPVKALEAAVAPAVAASPCLVSFSGGLDSSLVLCLATRVARREGFADPIPVTWRFSGAPRAHESEWQEVVVKDLRISDWEQLEADDDLDWVGPVARRVLARHGLLYPANSFLHEPLLARATGGTLLTGVGGDQIFGRWRGRAVADLLARRRPPSPRDPLRLARACAPLPVRALRERPFAPSCEWLSAEARDEFVRRFCRERAAEPMTWHRRLPWQLSRRDTVLSEASLTVLGDDAHVKVINPLLEPGFVAALAHAGGRLGFGNRRQTVVALFGPVLPPALLRRRDKAVFDQVFWRAPSREFTSTWDGSGVEEGLVDADALRILWSADVPPALTSLLLQRAWLRAQQTAFANQ